ncbi:MAG: hypothetical protein GY842_11535, partial [bacterium]|nr:hypothetical protein [bacterium]
FAHRAAADPPPSGTFALHGRPMDVLSDGHVLVYIRARFYDPKHARWLQRDPTGYTDGNALYEAFASNATANTDPKGEGVLTWLMGGYYDLSDAELLRQNAYHIVTAPAYGFFEGAGRTVAAGGTEFGRIFIGESSAQQSLVNLVEAEYGIGRATADETEVVVLRAVGQGVVDFFGASNAAATVSGEQPVFAEGGAVYIADLSVFERVQAGVGAVGQFAGSVGGLGGGGLSQATQLQMARLGLRTAARVAPVNRTTQVAFLRAGLAIERSQFALGTSLAAETAGARAILLSEGTRPSQLALNIAAGGAAETTARSLAVTRGETILEAQFRQGAVTRGIDFASFARTQEGGVQLFLNEVKATPGLVTPGRFTSLGLGRGGLGVFHRNVRQVRNVIRARVSDRALRRELLQALPNAEIRLIGPSGFRVTAATETRIQTATGRNVLLVTIP